jgi:hypothetical protein
MIEGLKGGFVFSKDFFNNLQGHTKWSFRWVASFVPRKPCVYSSLSSKGIGVSINMIREPAPTFWTPFVWPDIGDVLVLCLAVMLLITEVPPKSPASELSRT